MPIQNVELLSRRHLPTLLFAFQACTFVDDQLISKLSVFVAFQVSRVFLLPNVCTKRYNSLQYVQDCFSKPFLLALMAAKVSYLPIAKCWMQDFRHFINLIPVQYASQRKVNIGCYGTLFALIRPRSENTHFLSKESITVWLSSYLTGLDSTKEVNLLLIQHIQSIGV